MKEPKESKISVFFAYLRKTRREILTALGCAALLAAVALLSEIPPLPLVYGGLLCALLLAAVWIARFVRFAGRHRRMQTILAQLPYGLENLPDPESLSDEDDYAIFRRLSREIEELRNRAVTTRAETVDYYTAWVHQIKTPIAAMRLLLQSGEVASPEIEEELFEIEQYVGMVLCYLRMESEFTDYRIRVCSLDAIVRSQLRAFGGQFVRRKLILDFRPTGYSVLTDEKWLSFVIGQLLSNSLKYTRKGKISIYADEGRLVIEDSGMGIAAEDLPRLGQKGFTGANGRQEEKSTGLGLYLCRTVLGRLSHTMEFESTVGVGTRVILGFDREELGVE